LYQQAGSFIEDLYKLNLSATEQLWIFLAFFLAYAIPIIPFHTWRRLPKKAPAVGTMLLSGIMLKMGLYSIIRWQLPLLGLQHKEYMYIFISLELL
jgi:NADH-quinone oxidoreductase subunit M